MNHEEPNNAVKTAGVLVLGAAIGAVIGILFAPDKGSVTRRRMVEELEKLTDLLKTTPDPTQPEGFKDPEKDKQL